MGTDPNSADVRLAFRLSVHDGDWTRASMLAPIGSDTVDDGWLLLWIIRSIQPQLDGGSITTAEPALDFVRNTGSANPQVWYALGRAYESGGLSEQRSRNMDTTLFDGTLAYEDNTWFDRAALAYLAGLDIDSKGAWTEGTYDLAMLYYHQARWHRVIQGLEPVLANATDEQIKQPIYGKLMGGPNWQGVYLLLGHSYEQIGDWEGATRTWKRMVTIQGANQDWTLNIGLRSLGAIEARQTQFESALEHLAQALDLAFTFPDDYRATYQQDTWAYVLNTVHETYQQSTWAHAQQAAEDLRARFPNRASVWYIYGAFEDAECHQKNAAAAYAQAQRLMPEGAGGFTDIFAASAWHCINGDLERP